MPKTKRSTQHSTFVIERTYDATPSRVFAAWSDPEAKAQWFGGPDEWTKKSNYRLDFRVGGEESVSGGPPGGTIHYYKAILQDIVPNERIVSTYDMHLDKAKISVSLATVQLHAAGAGTRLVYTEQAVFLDGYDDAGSRERGTRDLLDKLGKALEAKK
jgi:uncharacterized protein YndB with AHSA1/START domain